MSDFRMKPMYQVLLYGTPTMRVGLFQLYKATPEQLCRVHYSPGSLKAIKARLKTLVRYGYIQYDPVAVLHVTPTRKFFSARYFYTLAPAGVKYLAGLRFDIDESWRPHSNADPYGQYVPHTLEVNDMIIAAALLRRDDPRFYLEGFTHEHIFKRQPLKTERGDLSPDASLDFRRVGSDDHFLVLLEHDRDTEGEVNFRRKIEKYIAFIKAGGHRQTFESTRVNVAFSTFSDEKRLNDMRKYTRQVLQRTNEPPEMYRVFRFAMLPSAPSPTTAWLEPRWQYPFDDQPQPLLAA